MSLVLTAFICTCACSAVTSSILFGTSLSESTPVTMTVSESLLDVWAVAAGILIARHNAVRAVPVRKRVVIDMRKSPDDEMRNRTGWPARRKRLSSGQGWRRAGSRLEKSDAPRRKSGGKIARCGSAGKLRRRQGNEI